MAPARLYYSPRRTSTSLAPEAQFKPDRGAPDEGRESICRTFFVLLPLRPPVNGVDLRAPLEKLAASLLHLFLAPTRQVRLLERIFGQVKELVGLVIVVIDVLLGALEAFQAR